MTEYLITFAQSARRELENLNATVVRRIFPRIEGLASEPRPAGARKIRGETSLWRIRIGDYRVIYSVDDRHRVVDITAVRRRRDAYK